MAAGTPDLTVFERIVVDELVRLGKQRASLQKAFDGIVAAADLEPPDDEHDPDGTTAYERAQVASLITATDARLALLEAAQGRIASGDFGRCDRCDRPIGVERLTALPETTTCVTCAAASQL